MSAAPQVTAFRFGHLDEDRLFRRVLTATLVTFLLLGAVVPNILLPRIEAVLQLDTPPRLARIIADPVPTGGKAVRHQASQPRAKPAPPKAAVRRQTPPSAAAQRKQPVSKPVERMGVLAMNDALAQLRDAAPVIQRAERRPAKAAGGANARAAESGVLTAGVTVGAGDSAVDVTALQSLLQSSGLQPEAVVGAGPRVDEWGGASPETTGRDGVARNVRSEEEIQAVLNRNKRAIYKIYNRELRKDASLRGKVVVSITIAPSGAVSGARIIYSELKSESLETELIRLIRRIDFGAKPESPKVTTKVPIEFFPV